MGCPPVLASGGPIAVAGLDDGLGETAQSGVVGRDVR
jgi:hypothetical protein